MAHQARASVGQAQGPGAPLSFSSPDVLLSLDLSLTDMNWPWLDRRLPAGVGQAGGRDRPRQLGRCQPCPKIFLARAGHDGPSGRGEQARTAGFELKNDCQNSMNVEE